MRTVRSLPYGGVCVSVRGVSLTETPLGQRPPLDRESPTPVRDPLWTEALPGQRPPLFM